MRIWKYGPFEPGDAGLREAIADVEASRERHLLEPRTPVRDGVDIGLELALNYMEIAASQHAAAPAPAPAGLSQHDFAPMTFGGDLCRTCQRDIREHIATEPAGLDIERLAAALDAVFHEAGAGLRGLRKVCSHDAYWPLGDPGGDQIAPGEFSDAIAAEYARLAEQPSRDVCGREGCGHVIGFHWRADHPVPTAAGYCTAPGTTTAHCGQYVREQPSREGGGRG